MSDSHVTGPAIEVLNVVVPCHARAAKTWISGIPSDNFVWILSPKMWRRMMQGFNLLRMVESLMPCVRLRS